jgi:hypothetical protein
MISFVILCYQLIATVTIYFELSIDNIMKIYCNMRLYWPLEIYKLSITYNLNNIKQ